MKLKHGFILLQKFWKACEKESQDSNEKKTCYEKKGVDFKIFWHCTKVCLSLDAIFPQTSGSIFAHGKYTYKLMNACMYAYVLYMYTRHI